MTSEARTLLQKAEEAKALYSIGKITRGQAELSIAPYINYFNTRSKSIAKKYNQRPKLINLSAFIR